jgi:hypothetical protein
MQLNFGSLKIKQVATKIFQMTTLFFQQLSFTK